ncbi:MAG: OsmC family peroxiredoxin [Alteromonadaceae bacterium]|jgi:osmotically inducible protein OsmC|uniref:Osmotically inducible protein OsmC n=2 Tax=Paraglaciecola mesophila TaxID=197222 RepID=K6YF18_9ALTE|nr:OsmC family protein [Paraglaciecola mesophila]MAD18493.1 OsmC family peroxiredoxin [Alteromonadaceae bacterium]MBB18667.1 OsmC family peroxiredoxin [Rickettsiales bacterium]GAC22576.1 osmotically inducible protein OsmC [Paraglaciecola mesophila KMM 241]|tara:strand:- start:17900 stop:18331 length:432 start_codon:yes stop_codon:yes gene_type:complete|eukprot:TRINITY_DN13018_c0_g1_i1.p2 TRINITY_DN13018_c0_g1~~TRINITY_DN13018_c0_g1_i1.p2  ORF type:complete len:144 (+),score=39.12 TRINITY_DN13018_c0_g1_i1:708-1139(+)
MSIVKSGSATYKPLGKKGKGSISTETGALSSHPYGFNTRFEDGKGSNPEELIGAAHASCFTMALSLALADAGYEDGELKTTAKISLDKTDDGFKISQSALSLSATVEGISEDEFAKIAQEAKANCPVSKLLDTKITLEFDLSA